MSDPSYEAKRKPRLYLNLFIGGVSLYSLIQTCKFSLQAHRKKNAILQAERTKEYTPEQLLKKIRDHTNNLKDISQLRGVSYCNNSKTEIKGRVFLSGAIATKDNPIIPDKDLLKNLKSSQLIYSVRYSEEVFQLDYKNKYKREYRIIDLPNSAIFQRVKEFQLVDIAASAQSGQTNEQIKLSATTKDWIQQPLSVNVKVHDDLDFTRAIQLIGSETKLIMPSIGNRLVGMIMLLIKLITGILLGQESPLSSCIRGIKIGVTTKEIGIKVDSLVSVYGEVVYNIETGQLRFDLPEAVVKNKSDFISRLKEGLMQSRFYRNLFGAILASTLLYFGRRLFLSIKHKQEKKREKEVENQ